MAKIKEKRNQVLFFETTSEELRNIANVLERGDYDTSCREATFFLNETADDFNEDVCLRFIKSKSK